MGVIYSIPLCSRGDNKEAVQVAGDNVDGNNNQPMPSLHQNATEPVTLQPQSSPSSLVNANAPEIIVTDQPPEATSTPKSGSRNALAEAESLGSSDIEGRVIDGEPTSDSGLEQSSSDELELGLPRPLSTGPPPLTTSGGDEGVTELDADVTLPLSNRASSDEEDDEADDPVERPPEPTVPDERVDSTSSDDSANDDRLPSSTFPPPAKTDATASAISDLLSEIVGGDRPYNDVSVGSRAVAR